MAPVCRGDRAAAGAAEDDGLLLDSGSAPGEAAAEFLQSGHRVVQARWRQLREEAYQQGLAEYDELIKLSTFKDFVVLYIAEGRKRNRNSVAIGNSDPRVVTVAAGWQAKFTDRRLIYSIQYHADQELDKLREYWGDLVSIDGASLQFRRNGLHSASPRGA